MDGAALARIDKESLRLDKLPEDPRSVKAQIDVGAGYGGAVLGYRSGLAFSESVFFANSAYWAGGAILSDSGTLSTDDSFFAINSVGGDYGDRSDLRGADVEDYAEKLNDVYMEPNGGGAVNNLGGTYGAKRSQFIYNYGDQGAAVRTQAGSTTLKQCEIAMSQGAAVVSTGAGLLPSSAASTSEYRFARLLPEDPEEYPSGTDIDRCLFAENDGFFTTYLESHPTRVTNSLFIDNWAVAITAIEAGGLSGSLAIEPEPDEDITVESSIEGCTYVDNYVDFATIVGPIQDYTPVVNTIMWGNDAWDPFAEAVNIDAFNVCYQGDLDTDTVVDSFSEDPMLADDYSLTAGSPCIDAGTASPEYPVKATEGPALAWDLRPWDFRNLGRPLDGDGDGTAVYDVGAFEYLTSGRVAGPTRIETAVKISQQHFGQADVVVIATGRVFADGLSGSGLAGMHRSPILLTEPGVLPGVVADEIVRLGATRAVILGGPVAVAPAVEKSLEDLGLEIERIGGADRYETAAMIAERLMTERRTMFIAAEDPEFPDEPEIWPMAFIARGDLFADALAVSPVAYANQLPVLLVRPDELPEHTVDVLVELGLSKAVVLGGDVAVNSLVAAEVGALAEDVVRIDGADRYETAANIAEWSYDNYLADFTVTGVATGEDFADALSGGAGIGSMNGVLLLNPQATVHAACKAAIEGHAGEIQALIVLGGPAAISESVYEYLMGLLAP
jgi:putative cell wall-binding protein